MNFGKDFDRNKLFVHVDMAQMIYIMTRVILYRLLNASNRDFGNERCIEIPMICIRLAFESIAVGVDFLRNEFEDIKNCSAFARVFEVRKAVEFSSNSKLRGFVFGWTLHERKYK